MSSTSSDFDTLERLVPEESDQDEVSRLTFTLHVDRYRFAARHCLPGRVLDIACGVGYGSRLIGDLRDDVRVVGVDVSRAAIRYADEHYADSRVSFAQCDAMTFSDDRPFDTIVSLETIEHLPDPDTFITRLVTLLRAGGTFVASVPTTPSVDANPHHLHDFTRRKLCDLVEKHGLAEIDAYTQVQPFNLRSVLTRADSRARNTRPNLAAYYLHHPSALVRRLASTVRHGLANHYVTIAWQARGR